MKQQLTGLGFTDVAAEVQDKIDAITDRLGEVPGENE